MRNPVRHLNHRLGLGAVGAAVLGFGLIPGPVAGAQSAQMESIFEALAPKVGSAAPDFTVRDVRGGEVALAELLTEGPVILYLAPPD